MFFLIHSSARSVVCSELGFTVWTVVDNLHKRSNLMRLHKNENVTDPLATVHTAWNTGTETHLSKAETDHHHPPHQTHRFLGLGLDLSLTVRTHSSV